MSNLIRLLFIYTESSPGGVKLSNDLPVTSEHQREVQYVPITRWPSCGITEKA